MAIPPEALDELLAKARVVVLARVSEIVSEGVQPQQKEKPHPSHVDIGNKKRSQRVKLEVERVLKGLAPASLTVEKPEGAYVLAVGDTGPFFLAEHAILGRYGPETHRLEKVEAALREKKA